MHEGIKALIITFISLTIGIWIVSILDDRKNKQHD